MPEWLDLLKLIPAIGSGGAIFALVWYNEKQEHAKTREELKRCWEGRVSEAMEMTKVITANSAASEGRDRSQEQLAAAFNAQTNALQASLAVRK